MSKIEKEFGSVENFIEKFRKWKEKLPKAVFEENRTLRKLAKKPLSESESARLRIAYRNFTSLEHAEWLKSVIVRIDKIADHISRTKPERFDKHEKPHIESEKESALGYVKDVRRWICEYLEATEDQLKTLNGIYEKHEKIQEIQQK